MKRSFLHIAIGLATTAFLMLGPVSAQARTDGGQAPAVHAPLATSVAAASADMSSAKAKADDRDRDRGSRHGDDKDGRRGDDRDRRDRSRDDRDHGDRDHGDRDHRDRDHRDGDHHGDRCDDSEGLLSGLLCLLLG